ncbi:nitrile hydratase accessory protein [Ancylobacter pratisalsi]|uniref:Nitrile hydratase accessory protein n=1 Tax=Ancylobacter pratisalsi TaxID=1745854 RepID=A0A6P1YPE7_9HYPH|nr:nitrile hydratase accessory protein [Ancylobacter pratisalsi]QIB33614.1 nitrile hydratase accessory protein [Ancylobacter pratisalsi]
MSALPDCEAPQVFAAPWEAQIFAMVVELHKSGLFEWRDFADRLSREIHAHPDEPYYHCWTRAALDLLTETGLVDEAELLAQSLAVISYRAQDHHHTARTEPIAVVPGRVPAV